MIDIRTPSLRLRPFVPADAPRIMALNAEPSTRLQLPSHVYADLDEAVQTINDLIACYDDPGHPARGPYVLAVDDAVSGDLLGHVGFSPLDDDVEVSYAIAEAARGRGWGAEALRYACDRVAERFAIREVIANTAADNIPSRRTLERAGFVHLRDENRLFQGVPKDVSCYARRL